LRLFECVLQALFAATIARDVTNSLNIILRTEYIGDYWRR
jgi:hypothetical protein